MTPLQVGLTVAVGIVVVLALCLRVIQQYERGVVYVFGKVTNAARQPGLTAIIPLMQRLEKVSTRLEAMDVPKQDIITRDNVPARVNAVVFFRVAEPVKAVIEVKNYVVFTSQKAQTTLRSVLGGVELDGLLTEREALNKRLEEIMAAELGPIGIVVDSVEIKDVELPEGMQRAMARQAEAERERRAKVIAAEGELQAAEQLASAADILDRNSSAITLRYLQTLAEIATEQNSTTLFPIPMDLFKPFFDRARG
ncbi:MAG: slipin family protein [Fimbriimonadaceae bacterium]|nr:slipin family protein [Fimbriimonadaceae bacterium]